MTAANVLSLGNLSTLAARLLSNKSAAISALVTDPAKRAAVVTNKTLGRINTLQRAFNKTRAPLPSVLNAATLRATFTDETLHGQVYTWNNQGLLNTGAAGGISTNNSTFWWIDDSVAPPVAVPDLSLPPPVPGESLPEGLVELPAGVDPACVTTGTCPGGPPNVVDIIGGELVGWRRKRGSFFFFFSGREGFGQTGKERKKLNLFSLSSFLLPEKTKTKYRSLRHHGRQLRLPGPRIGLPSRRYSADGRRRNLPRGVSEGGKEARKREERDSR